jgi:hypothetical protein
VPEQGTYIVRAASAHLHWQQYYSAQQQCAQN